MRGLDHEQIKERLRRYDIRLITLAIRLKNECLALTERNKTQQAELSRRITENPHLAVRDLDLLLEGENHAGNVVKMHHEMWDAIDVNLAPFAKAAYAERLERLGRDELMVEELERLVQDCLRRTQLVGERPRE